MHPSDQIIHKWARETVAGNESCRSEGVMKQNQPPSTVSLSGIKRCVNEGEKTCEVCEHARS